MWICLNNSFLSIVKKDCAPNELLVRARRRGDIETVFPQAQVTYDPRADYLYRARIRDTTVAKALAREVRRINYPNFKAAADPELATAYAIVWSNLFHSLDERFPLTGGSKGVI